MRKRECKSAWTRLARRVDRLRSTKLPSDAELLALSWRGWSALDLDDADKALLSAYVRIRAREDEKKLALLTEQPQQQRNEERWLITHDRIHAGPWREAAEGLVGALWDLVPYGMDPRARASLLKELWPTTPYQLAHWDELTNLAEQLAERSPQSPLRDSWIPSWTTTELPALEPGDHEATADQGEPSAEEPGTIRAQRLAEVIAHASGAQLEEFDPRIFANPRLAAFVGCFGAKALRKLALSTRPAVALAICTSFLSFDRDSADSGWSRAVLFLRHVEELVGDLRESGSLGDANFSGGPFCAQASDLANLIVSSEALETFTFTRRDRWDNELSRIGELNTETRIAEAGRAWDEIFEGVSLMCDFVNEHLGNGRYGCEVDGYLLRPPRRPRLGPLYVSDDQIDDTTAVRLFCFGCDVLSQYNDYLRVWLALWIGGLRPRESHVEGGDLVPYGRGFLVTVPRRFGKTGWREAMFPRSALEILGLTPDHFFPDDTRGDNPTALAEAACEIVRTAWEERRCSEPSLALVPGRQAYFPREVMADIIRRHQRVPWVLTKAYGHETETSDQAYTQLTSQEAATMYQTVWAKLKALAAPAERNNP